MYFVTDFEDAFATNSICYSFKPPIGTNVVNYLPNIVLFLSICLYPNII